MRILVTGGAGFVPSHLCERLLRDGHTVTALDNFVTGHRRNLEPLQAFQDRFHFIQADISAAVPSADQLGPVDRVFHMASPASPIDYVELPFETLYVGSDGTRNALDVALRDGARFLQASTSEVYGDPAVHPQVETYWGNVNPIGPRSVYDEAKRYAEALTMAYHRYKKVQTRIVRIFNTYGPRMRANDGRVMPAFVNQALDGRPLTVFGDGEQTRSFCYVTDLVDGIVRLMESDLDQPCNLGNPHEMSMNQLAEYINRFTNNQGGLVHMPLPQDDPTRRRPDISRAREHLHWEPQVDFETGVGRTVDYFRSLRG